MNDARLIDMPIGEFLERLASDSPTPGGGSVAALAGALAAGLGQMACALTVGRPKFAAVEQRVRAIDARLAHARGLLAGLIDEDAAAYRQLSAALRLNRGDAQRPAAVAACAELAATVPLETLALVRRVAADLRELLGLANPNLRSDVEAGLHLAEAGAQAAAANVRVNLPLVRQPVAQRLRAELERMSGGPTGAA